MFFYKALSFQRGNSVSVNRYERMNREYGVCQGKQRVAAYCRVSTDQEDQINSLESQQKYFRQYIQNHQDWELFAVFADAAVIIGLKTLRLKKCWKFGAFWAFSHKICE